MHKYLVEVFRYNESGSVEEHPFLSQPCDNELQLMKIRDQYQWVYNDKEVIDPETGEPTIVQYKAYKIRLFKLEYKIQTSIDEEIAKIFDLVL